MGFFPPESSGLATKEQDDDGRSSSAAVEFITDEQVGILSQRSADAHLGKDDMQRFLAVIDCVDFQTIPQSKYVEAKNLLDRAVTKYNAREAKK